MKLLSRTIVVAGLSALTMVATQAPAIAAPSTSGATAPAVDSSPSPDGPFQTLGGCSSFPPTPCGEVHNNSSQWIDASLNWACGSASYASWGSTCVKDLRRVAPGAKLGGGSTDVDAYGVPSRCTLWVTVNGTEYVRGSGWFKINNLQTATVTNISCMPGP